MGKLFLHLINTGITASWIVLVIIGLRLLLKKVPKWIYCLLWAVVGLRLLLPFSVESAVSLIPSVETINPDLFFGRIVVQSGVPALDAPINNYLSAHYYESITVPTGFFDACMDVLSRVWLIGMAVLFLYTMVSYLQLYRKTAVSIQYKENIYFCDHIDTPFVLGILRPRICLPSDLNETQMQAVIRHEQAHLRRKDHWWKPLAFVLLILHWFNPLMWLAFWMFSRDLELACDEQAVQDMNVDARKDYSRVLLSCSTRRRKLVVCPLAFGEVGVKRRIRSVLQYHKAAFWVKAAALLLCAVVAVCFLTSPLPGSRALVLPQKAHSEKLIMNSMHDPLRSHTDMETFVEFAAQSKETVPSCAVYDKPHVHRKGSVSTGTRCKVCGTTVYSGSYRNGEECEIGGLI